MTTYISAKDTAKEIRIALKGAFPGVKFSVRRQQQTIYVAWTDGPTEKKVKDLTQEFEGSWFDGSDDSTHVITHEYNGLKVRWGADFIFTNREISTDLYNQIQTAVEAKTGHPLQTGDEVYFYIPPVWYPEVYHIIRTLAEHPEEWS
jgi:hypothetical protein